MRSPVHAQRALFGAALAFSVLATQPLMAQTQAAPVPAVTVEPATMTDVVQTATFDGRAVANQKVDIQARVTGFLSEIGFTEGSKVANGQVLFRIDPQEFQAALAQADANVAAMQAAQTLANITRDRMKELVARQASPQAQLDQAVAESDRAAAQLLGAQAQRDQAALNLSYTNITAPFAGLVSLSNMDVGALIGPSSGTLVTLVSSDPMMVDFPVPEREFLLFREAVKSGTASGTVGVQVVLADGTVYPLPGKVNFANVVVTQSTDSILIRAEFPNPDGVLRDGALVTVSLEEQTNSKSLTVPQASVLRDMQGAYVLVVGADGTVEQRRVETGATVKGRTVITSGLAEGDNVITEGLNKARPGIKVDAAVGGGN